MRLSACVRMLVGCAWTVLASRAANPGPFEVVHEWKMLEFAWKSDADKTQAIESENFVQENCILSDVKVLDGDLFVTVPRWRHGVPASVNRVLPPKTIRDPPLLQPYPSWQMNEPSDDCSGIQYAHAIEIDPLRRMWILDSGKWGTFTRPNSRCPAKLLVWDMDKSREVRRFIFPDDVVDRAQSLLQDIALDTTSTISDDWFAYIASTGETRLIVYSWRDDAAWFISHHRSMNFDHSAIMIMTNPSATLPMGISSLALSPYTSQYSEHLLYYAPLASYQFFSIPTRVLKNRTSLSSGATDALWDSAVRRVGVRSSQSAGMTVSSQGTMYYSLLNNNAINQWNISSPFSALNLVYRDDQRLQWPDSFGWGGGYLYFTSNRMQLYVHHDLDKDEKNFRIMRVKLDAEGYMGRISAANTYGFPSLLLIAASFSALVAG